MLIVCDQFTFRAETQCKDGSIITDPAVNKLYMRYRWVNQAANNEIPDLTFAGSELMKSKRMVCHRPTSLKKTFYFKPRKPGACSAANFKLTVSEISKLNDPLVNVLPRLWMGWGPYGSGLVPDSKAEYNWQLTIGCRTRFYFYFTFTNKLSNSNLN